MQTEAAKKGKQKYLEANRDVVRMKNAESQRRHYFNDKARHLYHAIVQRCVGRFDPPDFDLAWLRTLIDGPLTCECCSKTMNKIGPPRDPDSMSVDRVDNAKGYIKSNIALICWACNDVKRTGSAFAHERIAAWMRKRGVE